MTRKELPAQAANIKRAVGSSKTCTPAIVDSLEAFLLPTKSKILRKNAASSESCVPKPIITKARSGRTAAGQVRKTPEFATLEIPQLQTDILRGQEKWILATEVFNIILKALSEAIKNLPTSQNHKKNPSIKSASSPPVSNSAGRASPSPLQPISVNQNSSRDVSCRQRRSPSAFPQNHMEGVRAQADCARTALAALRSMHSQGNFGADMPYLQLETGMSALIGKLIAIGFNDLATKELRILKRRLEDQPAYLPVMGEAYSARPGKIVEDFSALSTKEPLVNLLHFNTLSTDYPLLGLMITSQLQVIRLIILRGKSDAVEAALKHLQVNAPCSPVNLIERQMVGVSPGLRSKTARQLESLAQLMLVSCQILSDSSREEDTESPPKVHAETVFQIKALVLDIRSRWWKLSDHQIDVLNEVIKPFSSYLSSFHHRANLAPGRKYEIAKITFQRCSINFALETNIVSEEGSLRDHPLLLVYYSLAELAQENRVHEEALQWLQNAIKFLRQNCASPAQTCALQCKITILRMRMFIDEKNNENLLLSLKETCESLEGDLRGESVDYDNLLIVITTLRKLAFAILHDHQKLLENNAIPDLPDILDECSRVILLGLKFLIRYLGNSSALTKNAKGRSRYDQRKKLVWNNTCSFFESLAAMTRFSVTFSMRNWEKLNSGLQDGVRLAYALSDAKLNKDFISKSDDMKELSLVPLSNAYWCRYLYLKRTSGPSREIRNILSASIDILKHESTVEKLKGLLPTKLEHYGGLHQVSKEYVKAADLYTEALQLLVDGKTLEFAANVCAVKSMSEALGEKGEYNMLGRLLYEYSRVTSRMVDLISDSNQFFDNSSLDPRQRGLLLEQQLSNISSILHDQGPSTRIFQILKSLATSLLEIYNYSQYPIRRLRASLQLLQIHLAHPTAFDADTLTQIRRIETPPATMECSEWDSNLELFKSHLLESRDVYIALLDEVPNLHVLERVLAAWSVLLQNNCDCRLLQGRVNDVASWLLQLGFLAEYFEMKGLDLLRLKVLSLIVMCQEATSNTEPGTMISSLSTLGQQLVRAGYTGQAGYVLHKASKLLIKPGVLADTELSWNLAFVEYAVESGNVLKAEEHLAIANSLFEKQAENERASGSSSKERFKNIQILSDANYASSLVAAAQGQTSKALLFARQNVKLNHKAWAMMEHWQRKNTSVPSDYTATSGSDSGVIVDKMSKLLFSEHQDPSATATTYASFQSTQFWGLVPRLFRGFVHLSGLFAHEGWFSEATYFMEQSQKIADGVHANRFSSQSLTILGDYFVRKGEATRGVSVLKQAEDMRVGLQDDHHMVMLEFSKAKSCALQKDPESEASAIENANRILEQLMEISFVEGSPRQSDIVQPMDQLNIREAYTAPPSQAMRKPAAKKPVSKSVIKPAMTTKSSDFSRKAINTSGISLLLRLKGTIFQRQAVAAIRANSLDLAALLLKNAAGLSAGLQDRILQSLITGELHLRQALDNMAADPIFCVLPESTISQPCTSNSRSVQSATNIGRSLKSSTLSKKGVFKGSPTKESAKETSQPRAALVRDFLVHLQQAHEVITSVYNLARTACSTNTIHIMVDLFTKTLMMLSAVTLSQAKGTTNSMFALYTMEIGRTVSIQRANLATQVERQLCMRQNLLEWPLKNACDVQDISIDNSSLDFAAFQAQYIDIIPSSWMVISISLSKSQDEIRLAKMCSGQAPFILSLPLRRHNSRDPDEECFDFGSGKRELEELVSLTNFSTHDGQNINRKGTKSQWWEVRAALDTRIKTLLSNIENVWIGGFRSIFSQSTQNPDLLARFQQSLQNILDKYLPSRERRGKRGKCNRITLDSRILELFVGLGMPTESNDLDEPLADLIYFVVDILQFHGEHNAYDEIDFDSITIEIVDALRQYHETAEINSLYTDQHIILILDKSLHCFPWESLPCMDQYAVSRLPSLSCLRDRILQIRHRNEVAGSNLQNREALHVGRKGGAAILNPAADLVATQANFEKLLDELEDWKVITQREPTEKEMKSCLEAHDIFLYFGHGSGAQYIRSRTIKKLEKCAVTLLMGCSSGVVEEAGEFEPYGTPINYMQAGCPALLVTLWDVTDKDIDRFSHGVLESWGLFNKQKGNDSASPIKTVVKPKGRSKAGPARPTAPQPVSLDQAVAQSRNLCKLRYLNGAAPVVYGIPVFLS